MNRTLIQRAARDILLSKKTVTFTGAGISVESGIPDFGGARGLWKKHDPEEVGRRDHSGNCEGNPEGRRLK